MAFIELTDYDTTHKILLATHGIMAVRIRKDGKGTAIWTGDGDDGYFTVRESYEHVKSLLIQVAECEDAPKPNKYDRFIQLDISQGERE